MSDLTAFLLARIAEDEDVVGHCLRAIDSDRTEYAREVARRTGPLSTVTASSHCGQDMGPRGTIEASPGRILAECQAKRRIVTEFGSQCGGYFAPGTPERAEEEQIAADIGVEYRPHWPEQYAAYCDGCAAAQAADHDHTRVLRLLALPYADHPDYREEWKP